MQSEGSLCGPHGPQLAQVPFSLSPPRSAVVQPMPAAPVGVWRWALWLLQVSHGTAQFCLGEFGLGSPVPAGDFAFLCGFSVASVPRSSQLQPLLDPVTACTLVFSHSLRLSLGPILTPRPL